MASPLIGITTYGQNEEKHFTLPREYVDSVRRAGGIPFLITPGETNLETVFSHLDGLILAGGGDLDPDYYDGNQHESIYMLDQERDESEFELARIALESEKPLFGICRGMQLLNIVLGGTLHEHLPDIVGEKVVHRLPPRKPTLHEVSIVEGSFLGQIIKRPRIEIASWHHQGIQKLASSFTAVSHADDGIVEAFEMASHPWLVGVQWHPEITSHRDPIQQDLFNHFVEATR